MSTAAELIAAPMTAFDNPDGNGNREIQVHSSMLELQQRKGESTAKYPKGARRTSEYIDPKSDHLLAAQYRGGFRSKSFQLHLSSAGVTGNSPRRSTGDSSTKTVPIRMRGRRKNGLLAHLLSFPNLVQMVTLQSKIYWTSAPMTREESKEEARTGWPYRGDYGAVEKPADLLTSRSLSRVWGPEPAGG